ncbi:histidine kinase [Gilvimarinus algae]|uniref:Histidine kinase n=1 Tax=Gilvimarinus algae TaxID=3058037 RepID=A0ABT8THC8_9GAMM|nr:histidine kinase [Gilvimarinus sp. SDUM040014]MDO3383504.1 histidine kinase [Gilvimarinus sp. SDUM040014]
MDEDRLRKLLHDARNPLNNISVNAELGKLTLQTQGDVDKAVAVFDKILGECRRCSETLESLSEAIAEEQQKGSAP